MLKNENTNKIKEELKQKHTVVYEIDLKNDIDKDKSPHNEIRQTDDYLEFVFEKGMDIPINDFEVVCGRLEEKANYLQGTLQEQSFYTSKNKPGNEKKFSAIALLRDEYDVLNVGFSGNVEHRFETFVYNECLYQIKKDVSAGVFSGNSEDNQDYKDRVASNETQFVTFNFAQKDSLTVFLKDRLMQWISFKNGCQDKVCFYLDYKSQKININNQKWRNLQGVDFDNLKYVEMRGSFQKDTLSFENDEFYLYQAAYAKNKGYIYLKSITLPKGNYKLFLYYAGEITLEYSKGEDDRWEILSNKFRLDEKQNLRFRIKINSGDKLYDMFIVNAGFKG